MVGGVHEAGNGADPDMGDLPGRVRKRPEQTETHRQLEDARITEVVTIEGYKLNQRLKDVGQKENHH
ncbi:hypothetical protein KSF_000580 [Reticulibacter mediterranei]|uniref:Uncharacterized protein n=1 Tax=Reticulibacter mediterranei TaxID=2778369 RepID=A0A8J3MZA9_9CHLR|nr:hypothetical protein [Reticulibacter mediterranei]GHO90010.1 hypothetical protein KSF_000580 [Reticulibacter mediterranei]